MDFLKAHTHTTFTTSGTLLFLCLSHDNLLITTTRWKPFDPTRNWPDLGPRFKSGEDAARTTLLRESLAAALAKKKAAMSGGVYKEVEDEIESEGDKRDLDWSAVLKRTFEAYVRGERPNMYGEWLHW